MKENEKKMPLHFDDIRNYLLDMFPEMQLEEDNYGQLIVYTGVESCSSDGYYAPIEEKEVADEDCMGV
jgi:hypothetical protein